MTSKQKTFNALDGAFLDTQNNTLNIGYLRECLEIIIDVEMPNNESSYHRLYNNRIKPYSIVWDAFTKQANYLLDNDYEGYTATSEHLKSYLDSYGYDYTKCFTELCELVQEMRDNKEE